MVSGASSADWLASPPLPDAVGLGERTPLGQAKRPSFKRLEDGGGRPSIVMASPASTVESTGFEQLGEVVRHLLELRRFVLPEVHPAVVPQ